MSKFRKANQAKLAVEHGLFEYRLQKKEENLIRQEQKQKSLNKIKRAQSVYKTHLCVTLMKKG
jgi:hypothetical protein